ncbi:hypothetical protein Goe27_02230 [Bacillus phage vB_BsuM-Goe27]|nr:hypothetical protein Goe24_02210 [Bacillus phage vB_BsuM-Goe24]WCS70101.1 hypothetical protein Goe27_02230 [Bacillus phage vB_BsuM-Goe27]
MIFNRSKPAPTDSEIGQIISNVLYAPYFSGYRTDSGFYYRTRQKNTTEAGRIETRDDNIYLFQKVNQEITNIFPAWGAWDRSSGNVYLFSRVQGDIITIRRGVLLQQEKPPIPFFNKESFLSYINNLNV